MGIEQVANLSLIGCYREKGPKRVLIADTVREVENSWDMYDVFYEEVFP